MSFKYNIEYVKKYVKQFGYKCTSDFYIDGSKNLEFKCKQNHTYITNFYNFKQGSRCYICNGKVSGTSKKDIKFIKQYISNFGYICLDNEYKNSYTKLTIICDKGHTYKTKWTTMQQGYRCPECGGKRRKTFKEVKEYIEKFGYKLLDKEYKNSYQNKLNLLCPNNHKIKMLWGGFQYGNRCRICAYIDNGIKITGSNHPNWTGDNKEYCYIWTDYSFKEYIRNRDNNRCLNPYCNDKTKKLHVHHIDYNKKNCNKSNLITLCNSCNCRANFDREWHKEWYKTIIIHRYGGKIV